MARRTLAEWLQGRSVLRVENDHIDEPIPVRLVEVSDTNAARQSLVNTSGEVTEASAVAMLEDTDSLDQVSRSYPVNWNANGEEVISGVGKIAPFPEYHVITADGAGNIGAATALLAAVAAKRRDLDWIIQVSVSGIHITKWCEDPAGTPAAGIPDYHGSPYWAPYLVAGYPYQLRQMTATVNKAFGYAVGTNGDWPNSSVMYISGYRRTVS